MPAPKPDLRTPEERKAHVEAATRSWRYKAAVSRVKRIVDGWPPLTDEQRLELARLLHPGA